MGNANSEITQAEYIRYIEITIPAGGDAPISLRAAIVAAAKLTDAELKRIVAIIVKDHGAEFNVGEESDLSGKNELVPADVVYTEPCIGSENGWLDKTFVRSTGVALTPLCKVYIGQAQNESPVT